MIKLNWQTMDTAPRDREILLFGTDYEGAEITAFGAWRSETQLEWETIVSTDNEVHKMRVEREHGYWDTKTEIFPTLWADVEHPMRPRLTSET